MNWAVQLCELNYDSNERVAVGKVLLSEWLTMGSLSNQFETEFQEYLGHRNQGIFVSSATAALHLILMSLGVSKGDEVILPALTFVSDANVVVQLGATPVFADSIGVTNFNVSPNAIIDKITKKTKAIVLVHFAGFPLNFKDLKDLAKARNIPIIEDCAHSPGAKINGQKCGTLGDYSFFSFFSNKNIAIGEGGMAFSKDPVAAAKIRNMRSHGMTAPTLDRHEGRTFSYDVSHVGLNYRADEIRAALGIEQLKKLEVGNAKRRILYERYLENLRNSEVLVPFKSIEFNALSAYHIMPVILPQNCDRALIMEKMKNAGIQTSIHYPSFASFRAYAGLVKRKQIPIAEEICNRELTLPMHPRLGIAEVDLVSKVLLECL
jgi:dTDP-4-amino-4,6-dideoxygalactose transaminase